MYVFVSVGLKGVLCKFSVCVCVFGSVSLCVCLCDTRHCESVRVCVSSIVSVKDSM